MLNKAAGKTVSGIESRQAAMRQCIKEMTDKGIPAFVDKRGREWSPGGVCEHGDPHHSGEHRPAGAV